MINSIWCECTVTFAFSQTVYIFRAGPQLQLRIMVPLLRQIRHLSWDVHTNEEFERYLPCELQLSGCFFSLGIRRWAVDSCETPWSASWRWLVCRNLDEGWRLLEGGTQLCDGRLAGLSMNRLMVHSWKSGYECSYRTHRVFSPRSTTFTRVSCWSS